MAPTLSIGFPVYNGESLLRRALASLLAQTVSDFEILISDNGSSDGTEAICREFAARDPRVRYVRQEKNAGSMVNFQRTLQMATGEYFFWASHDDQWPTDFAERGISALASVPAASAAMGLIRYVDATGREIRRHEPPYRLGGRSRLQRAFEYFWTPKTDELVYALFRRRALAAAPFILSTNPWKMIAVHALLWGPIIDAPQMAFDKLLVTKSAQQVAESNGIPSYSYGEQAKAFAGMTKVLWAGLGLVGFLIVFPVFFVRHNWHKFFAKRLLGRA